MYGQHREKRFIVTMKCNKIVQNKKHSLPKKRLIFNLIFKEGNETMTMEVKLERSLGAVQKLDPCWNYPLPSCIKQKRTQFIEHGHGLVYMNNLNYNMDFFFTRNVKNVLVCLQGT
ncbi:hypothetical protein ILYODFUR_029061 [Ilyodon furcidens]|uniref:Uncharacterized protein n=1 Tax=Ilyodon furcidens TaxID=33524 RepID=A0ABV0TML0_9TELE